jgi:hypothetical protein
MAPVAGISEYFRAFIFVSVLAQSFAVAMPLDAQMFSAFQDSSKSKPKPHSNHNPQHGGIFFMALDNDHHLEGVLLESKVFEVYLYDKFTKPLSVARAQQVTGNVQMGESDDAPRIPLVAGKSGQTLEARLSKDLKLPVTITLWLHFGDLGPNTRPEVFTFPFSHSIAADDHTGPTAAAGHSGQRVNGTKMDH